MDRLEHTQENQNTTEEKEQDRPARKKELPVSEKLAAAFGVVKTGFLSWLAAFAKFFHDRGGQSRQASSSGQEPGDGRGGQPVLNGQGIRGEQAAQPAPDGQPASDGQVVQPASDGQNTQEGRNGKTVRDGGRAPGKREGRTIRSGRGTGRARPGGLWARLKKWYPFFTGIIVFATILLLVWVSVRTVRLSRMDGVSDVSDVEGEAFELVTPLEMNAHEEVNELIVTYFTALATGDEEGFLSARDEIAVTDLLRMELNSEYIDGYEKLAVYTTDGIEEDSYVAFVYYEARFTGLETTLPGLQAFYVMKDENGVYCLHDMTGDDEVAEYVLAVIEEEEVAALYTAVTEEYENRLNADEEMADFIESYTKEIAAAVGEALEDYYEELEELEEAASEEEASDEEEAASTESADTSADSASESASTEDVPDSGEYTLTQTVNIRVSASETSDRIAVAYPGETIEILMKQEDGWTRVRYNGETGYVRSDVLY